MKRRSERMQRKEKIVIAILLLYLLLPTLFGVCTAHDMQGFWMRLVYLVSGIGLYALGLGLFKRRTFFYVACITFIPSGVEMVHLMMNHATTSMLFIFTCIKAEHGELMELISSYWFVLVIALVVWSVYFYLVHRFVQNEYIAPKRMRYSAVSLVCVWYIVCSLGLLFSKHPLHWLPVNMEEDCTSAWVGLEKSSPLNIALGVYDILSIRADIQRQTEELGQFRFDVQPADEEDVLVVLMIGETSRYDNWQLNGYSRETSPYTLARGEEIVSYSHCYTIANLTTVSVPYMLSPATPYTPTDYYKQKSVVEAFAEGGYQTAWIADQSFGNTFLHRISGTCDYCYYQPHGQLERTYLDTVLLEPLCEFLDSDTSMRNQLVVLHTLGCHFKYSSRYPDDFCYFLPDMKDIDVRAIVRDLNPEDGRLLANRRVIHEIREIFVNSYDNAIRYTDYMLERVIQTMEKTGRPCVLVYVGDHGENLLDDDRNMLMHGTFSGSVWEYHVPLFVWMSPQYIESYPDKAAAVRANRRKQVSTMNLFHSLPDAVGLTFDLLDTEKSIFSPTLVADTTAWGLDANLNLIALPTAD